MELLSKILPKLISMVLSWLDHGNLRNQVYELKDRVETLEIALEDIERMNKDPLIAKLIKTIQKR